MRKLYLSIFASFLFSFFASAQTKAQLTAKISIPTVQCEMAKKSIESSLDRYDGVVSTVVNVKRKEVTVKYLTDRTNIEVIKAAIANAGYDAGEIAANPETYKALPKCCKKQEASKKQ